MRSKNLTTIFIHVKYTVVTSLPKDLQTLLNIAKAIFLQAGKHHINNRKALMTLVTETADLNSRECQNVQCYKPIPGLTVISLTLCVPHHSMYAV